jgi:hypothetical protein
MAQTTEQQSKTGPDLSVVLEPVEYSTEAEAFIEQLEYRFPPCASCPQKY